MKVNGQGRSKLGQGIDSLQLTKLAWLHSDLFQALKEEQFLSSGLSTEGDLNFCVRSTQLLVIPGGLGKKNAK